MFWACPLCPLDISPVNGGNPTAPVTLTLALSHRGRGDTAASGPLWMDVPSAEASAFAEMTVLVREGGCLHPVHPLRSLRSASPSLHEGEGKRRDLFFSGFPRPRE